MPSQGEIRAAAKILSDPENDSLTAEEVAERVIAAYEEEHSRTHNLIVLGHFRLSETESYVAAVGPLSTRATARARGVGERFAWDYKTRKGTGKFVLVPLIRNPNEAWDEARRASVEAISTSRLAYELGGGSLSRDPFGPACVCGLDREALLVCPRHPEESSERRTDPAGD